jgi:neutral trehalase
VHTTAEPVEDPFVEVMSPYLVVNLDEPIGISTGRARALEEIRETVAQRREELVGHASEYGELAEAYIAVQAGIAWNLIYDPKYERILTTVGRLWNEERGGWGLFGWDNFLLPYVISLDNPELALATLIEHVRGATEEGFIPNDNQANERKSWDHSQPPVGGIMVKEIYKRIPEEWMLALAFDVLLEWNRWWPRKRNNEGLLSWGSHEAKNPFNERYRRDRVAAGWESGMDDSPMYEDIGFNEEKNTMELQDVGLNSLYIADCEALAEIAVLLGRDEDARELRERADTFRGRMEELWDEEVGLYLNKRTDTGELSMRLSPTLFYPLLAQVPSQSRAERIVQEHFYNDDEFWGDWVVPTIARNDPAFQRQRYWKGAIWPPTNFLTYLSLRKYGMAEAYEALAQKSLTMFMQEWKRKGFISENYSAITGAGDDPRLSSDNFHSWGTLFGIMAFIEAGFLPAPETQLMQPGG